MRRAALALTLVALACTSAAPRRDAIAIDHVILGVSNLDAGIAAFERLTGVTPMHGGKHPSGGTENALLSLGDMTYLELVAPRADADPNDGFAKYLRTLNEPTLIGWMLRVPDADAARARIRQNGFAVSEARPGSRVTPAGQERRWRTFALEGVQIATAPFFIEWGATTTHPSLSSPEVCSVRSFALADPKAAELLKLLAFLNVVDVPVRAAEKPHMTMTLRCGSREATFVSQ